jgi:AcrR family transcriptional regulator
MDDISKASGLSRRTVYYVFKSRRSLFLEILIDRIKPITRKVVKILKDSDDFETAIVMGSIAVIEIVLSDPIYYTIFEEDHTLAIHSAGTTTDEKLDATTFPIFALTFEHGRKARKIRDSLTDHQLADWIRSFHSLLLARGLTSSEDISRMMKTFFLPSIR